MAGNSYDPSPTLMQLLTPLFLRDLGQTLEGDVFHQLKQSPYILRALEFALADGAIDCSRERLPDTSFAERLWDLFSYEPDEDCMSDLLLFDIKSDSAEGDRSQQDYISIEAQRCRVAFWICISAADPAWVDVIPNRQQDPTALTDFNPEIERDASQRKANHISAVRNSRLHNAAHGFLDPCAATYRMPLGKLTEAIASMRHCALGLGDYVNPHTGVVFEGWRPITTRRTEWVKPAEGSSHYTAYQDAWEVFKGFRAQEGMEFDLVGIQPCLADFKIIQCVDGGQVQHFIQAKGDGVVRGPRNRLTKVGAARQGRHYFDTRDRHGFFYFAFDFSGNPQWRVAYFFPERVVPDHFYLSTERYVSFDIEEFLPYRIEFDDSMQWVHRMQEIIEDNPEPRKDRSYIPPRPPTKAQDTQPDHSETAGGAKLEDEEALDAENAAEGGYWLAHGGGGAQKTTAKKRPAADDLEKQGRDNKKKKKEKLGKKALKALQDKKHSRALYRDVVVRAHRRFFYSVMAQCAKRGRGLLIELARNGPPGDFGYCRYRWTQSERDAFFKYSHVPAAVHHLPSSMPIVAIFYYCRHLESGLTGPKITPKQYQRLDLCAANSLIFWDISGPDVVTGSDGGANGRPLLTIVPSEDVQPTLEQRAKIEGNLSIPQEEWQKHTPSISGMLNTGLFLTEYSLPRMPIDAGCDWSAIWSFLDHLSVCDQVEHPRGLFRDSKTYRQPLQAINQRLAEYWDAYQQRKNNQDSETEDEDEDEDEDVVGDQDEA